MSQLSKRRLKEEVSRQLFELTFSLLGERRGKDDFQKVVLALLSPSEQVVLSKRIATLFLLTKKIDCLVIRDVLKVSTSTISKCVMMLENSECLRKTLQSLARNRQIKDIFLEAFSDIYSPGSYGINWGKAHRLKRELERTKREGI